MEIVLAFRSTVEWDDLPLLRSLAKRICRQAFNRDVAGQHAELVVQELVQNVITYAPTNECLVEISRQNALLSIAVESEFDETRLPMLTKEIERVRAGTPQEAYRAALTRAMAGPSGTSRMGLARMRYEARMDLKLELVNSRLRVVAEGTTWD